MHTGTYSAPRLVE